MAFGLRMNNDAVPAPSQNIVRLEPDFDFRSAQYLRLFQNSPATAFQHPIWLDTFYRLVAPHRRAAKLVVTVRDRQTDALRVVLPLVMRKASGLTLIETTDLGISDIASPVIERGWRVPAGLSEEIASALPTHDLLRIRPVRRETVSAWQACIGGQAATADFFGPATGLSGPFPEWRSGARDQGFRKPLNAMAGRTMRSGATELRLLTVSRDIMRAIDAIRERRTGLAHHDPIQEAPVRDFYTTIAIAGSPAGFAHTYALIQDGIAIGHVFAITWRGRFHYLLVGCDSERNGRHASTFALYDTMIEDWTRIEGSVFDFTIGDESFRQEPAEGEPEMFVLTRTATWRGKLSRASLDATEHAARMQRGGRAA